jgi:UDP-glucuronate 4-epimerase
MESHTFESYPVNLAFGKPKSLNSVIEIFKEYFPSLEVIYAPSRKGDIRDSESDPKKLKQVIGDFEPTNLRDGLFSTFNWYNENLNV